MPAEQELFECCYEGVCPDCQTELPIDVQEGEECVNCGHVFWLPKENDA